MSAALGRYVLEGIAQQIEEHTPALASVLSEALRQDDRSLRDSVQALAGSLPVRWRDTARDAGRVLGPSAEPPSLRLGLAGLTRLADTTRLLPELSRTAWWRRVSAAHALAQEGDLWGDLWGALRELGPSEARSGHRLSPVVDGIVLALRREVVDDPTGRQRPAAATSGTDRPPASVPNSARGRASRAQLVLVVLEARLVELTDLHDGGRWWLTRPQDRMPLVEGLLLDPAWDDIDHSAQQDDVVAGVLGGAMSPGIHVGDRVVAIARIAR